MAELLQPFQDWLTATFGDSPLVAAGLVVAALLLGVVVQWLLTRIVLGWTRRTKNELDETLAYALQAPIVQTVVLLGLYLGAGRLGMSERAALVTTRALLTLALIVWTRAALKISAILLRWASARSDRFPLVENRTYPLFSNLSVVVLLIIGSYVLLMVWDVDATGWAASAGVLGLAFGFAAKDTLSNLFSGVFIVADAPYQLGDYIVLDDGVRGRVEHIGLRSTRIMTRDDVQITIPNSVIANSKIVNQSGGGTTSMRVRVQVGVSYDSDVDLVRELLGIIANEEALVRDDPAPRVRFRRLGDSSLEYELLGWVGDPTDRGRAVDALNTAIVKTFRARGVEIPYPQRTVHLRRESIS